ncbi:hypothetical protein OPV22_030336 [Ensete ventricosum]|uniref:Uncharacterized protein n=1 Tax=Ensete ventricosum TaxID=4639 RepID=A0AAV8QFZ1_ENSVE|nr:hypothetical protein OPV22_030336 [Ensete ventricosum]
MSTGILGRVPLPEIDSTVDKGFCVTMLCAKAAIFNLYMALGQESLQNKLDLVPESLLFPCICGLVQEGWLKLLKLGCLGSVDMQHCKASAYGSDSQPLEKELMMEGTDMLKIYQMVKRHFAIYIVTSGTSHNVSPSPSCFRCVVTATNAMQRVGNLACESTSYVGKMPHSGSGFPNLFDMEGTDLHVY